MNTPRAIWDRRDLLRNLVSRNLKSRYKDSGLGFLWSVLAPLLMALVYLVFLRILARGVPMTEVLIGVFAWQFTAQCVGNGLGAITENANLVTKVSFPRLILPMASALSNLVNFLLTLVVQFALVAILLGLNGQAMAPTVWAVPALILWHALFGFAITVFLSATSVYFRDLQHLVGVLLTAWFFLTPAMYSLELVRALALQRGLPGLPDWFLLNPMAAIITAYRALILPDAVFPWSVQSALGLFVIPPAFLLLALLVFHRLEPGFSDEF
jgi:ABC-type polysaccharide/polyol phosphate export permease